MSNTVITNAIISIWVKENYTPETIQLKLIELGYDTLRLPEILQEFKKQKRAKRQSLGFIYMIVGALLGFISCLLTIINPIPDLYNIILYGLTSIAIAFIVFGLYNVFED